MDLHFPDTSQAGQSGQPEGSDTPELVREPRRSTDTGSSPDSDGNAIGVDYNLALEDDCSTGASTSPPNTWTSNDYSNDYSNDSSNPQSYAESVSGDSAYVDDDLASSYASLTSEARAFVFENGRRYHGYKSGRYMLPNDESEMEREHMKHHISMLLTEGLLHLAPIGPNPQDVLDIGTGTGIWAIDMADMYSSAKVIATDLSPIQTLWVPPNLVFEVDDAEDEWLYKPESFDFIHCRYLFHGIRDWPKLLNQAMKFLRPGGWIELVEMHVIPTTYDNSLPHNSQILEFYNVLADIGSSIGIDLAVAEKFSQMMRDAGFEDVQSKIFDLPLGGWMEGRRMKEIGKFQQYQMSTGIHGIAFGLLTRIGGWAPQRVETFLAGVRKEMNDVNVHSLYKVHFVYGKRPGA